MRVAEVKRDKKHLCKVTFEDGGELLKDADLCADKAITQGLELDDEAIAELRYESDYTRAKSRALWYLDRNDYTSKALYLKLLRAGFGEKASAAAIARLTELEVVCDRRFAERFCERCIENNLSRRETLYKLTEKGVPYDMAREVLDLYEPDEKERIAALIERKYAEKLATEDGFKRVYAALVRKGFSYGDVSAALKKYKEELEYSEEY